MSQKGGKNVMLIQFTMYTPALEVATLMGEAVKWQPVFVGFWANLNEIEHRHIYV